MIISNIALWKPSLLRELQEIKERDKYMNVKKLDENCAFVTYL